MADWTAAQLRNAVLVRLGITGQGQTASGADAQLVDDVFTSVHAQLRKKGYAPFLTSAVPDWAKQPLTDYVAWKVYPAFGFTGQREASIVNNGREGERELVAQAGGVKAAHPTRAEFF